MRLSLTFLVRLGPGRWPSLQSLTELETGAVNTATGGCDYPNARWYGNTKQGKFMSQVEAHARLQAGKERAVKPSLVISVLSGSTAEHLSRLQASKLWEQEWTPDRRYLEPPRQFPPPIPEFAGFHKP